MSHAENMRVSRNPLSSADIKALVDTAVHLHSRALEHQKDKRWWIALASAIGAFAGASRPLCSSSGSTPSSSRAA